MGLKLAISFAALSLAAGQTADAKEYHCGVPVGDGSAHVNMWQIEPASARKTTREVVIATALAHEAFRVCKENRLTVIVRSKPGEQTVFYIKD